MCKKKEKATAKNMKKLTKRKMSLTAFEKAEADAAAEAKEEEDNVRRECACQRPTPNNLSKQRGMASPQGKIGTIGMSASPNGCVTFSILSYKQYTKCV